MDKKERGSGIMKNPVQAKDLKALNVILKNSFQAIKKDICKIKDNISYGEQQQTLHSHSFQDLRKEMGLLKKEFVTLDKYNFLKIGIGDLREETKRIGTAEKSIRDLNELCARKEETEKAIEDLRKEISAKNSGWKKSLQGLANEIDSEFVKINKNMEAIEQKGDELIEKNIGKFRKEFEYKIVSARKESAKYRKDMSCYKKTVSEDISGLVKKEQAEKLVKKINFEFNNAKNAIMSMGNNVEALDKDVGVLKKKIRMCNDIQRNFGIINTNFAELRSSVIDDVNELRDDMKSLGKRVREKVRQKNLKTEAAKIVKIKKKSPSFIIFSNLFIGAAFILLIVSGALFFVLDKTNIYVMDWVMGAAVLIFIIGIIFRIISAFKKEEKRSRV